VRSLFKIASNSRADSSAQTWIQSHGAGSFRCPFCHKVIGPQELIDNVGNKFIQIQKGALKEKPAHRHCFDLAVTLGEVEEHESEKLE
jgi:hypothetical protein